MSEVATIDGYEPRSVARLRAERDWIRKRLTCRKGGYGYRLTDGHSLTGREVGIDGQRPICQGLLRRVLDDRNGVGPTLVDAGAQCAAEKVVDEGGGVTDGPG